MWKCDKCQKEIPSYHQLLQHRRIHFLSRPYFCRYPSCCQAFRSALDLQKHHRKHADKRIYLCNICKTKLLYRHHLKSHRCRIRNTKIYHCHLCLEKFVQFLSLSHHIRNEHKRKVKKKDSSERQKQTQMCKDSTVSKEMVCTEKNRSDASDMKDSGQKILLKITAGKSMTLISPSKEKRSRRSKHKHKKMKKRLSVESKSAVSVKNGLVLTIRPVLFNSEPKQSLKKHTKSRTKLKGPGTVTRVGEPSAGLKLKIRSDQGKNHFILNEDTEQKVPKLYVSKRNLDNVAQGAFFKQSGSMIASKNIVKKYKNKKTAPENSDRDFHLQEKNLIHDKLTSESVPRIKNGIIIHKDKLGNYTSAEHIEKTKKETTTDIPKCKGGIWEIAKTELSKAGKVKKSSLPKSTEGVWEVMRSPRPDGTADILKLRLSPQKPLKLDVNSDIVYENSRFLDVDSKSKEIMLAEDSDTFETSPATDKDLELGINSVNDSGIEVLSSSSCNRSNGNSVRSVMLDENSPSYFQCEDSLLSFDSPINDPSKYEHSICGKCGGIVMEANNNTQSPTKCHCDSDSPLQSMHEKAGYIYISPLKDPSLSVHDNNALQKFSRNEKINSFVSIASESYQATETEEKLHGREVSPALKSQSVLQQRVRRSIFDFNEDEDFSVGKPVLDHVKNPLVLNKTEDEKKQERILLADLQEQEVPEVDKKKTMSSKNKKLSRSPRRKSSKQDIGKSSLVDTSRLNFGKTSNKPIIIEEDDENVAKTQSEDLINVLKVKSSDLIEHEMQNLNDKTVIQNDQTDFGFQAKNKVIRDTAKSIIVAIAKTEKTTEKTSVTPVENASNGENSEDLLITDGDPGSSKTDSNISHSDVEQKADVNIQESLPNIRDIDKKSFENSSEQDFMGERESENVEKVQRVEITENTMDGAQLQNTRNKQEKSKDNESKLNSTVSTTQNKHIGMKQTDVTAATGICPEMTDELTNEMEDTSDIRKKTFSNDSSSDTQKLESADSISDKETKQHEESNLTDSSAESVFVPQDTSVGTGTVLLTDIPSQSEKPQSAVVETMNCCEDDSLLQVLIVENKTDNRTESKHAEMSVKTAVVMNSDEDSLLTIPSETNKDTESKTHAVVDKKSPLDMFQQQFLSFLSQKPQEPEESDKESDDEIKEYKNDSTLVVQKRIKPQISGGNIKKSPKDKESSEFVDSERHTPLVDLIKDEDSESEFDAPNHSRKRKKSALNEKETKNETALCSSSVYYRSEGIKRRKSSIKDNSRSSESGGKYNSDVNIVKIVRESNLKENIAITDSDVEFELQSPSGKDRKKSLCKRTPKNLSSECPKLQKHRDYESDESDTIVSDSEMERCSADDSDLCDNVFDNMETKINKSKSDRQKRERLTQSVTSVSEDIGKKRKINYRHSVDTKLADSADSRSQRSKKGRKSFCPCCLGSPRSSRRESHQHKIDYKLPKNHEKFIADTVKLLKLKAKIHRLFLSLFPHCKELIRESDINTLAFDDLIDDVLSSLRSDISFEPEGNDVYIGSGIGIGQENPAEQILGNHLNSQSTESNVEAKFDSSEATVDENLSGMVNTNNPVVFVPGIQLMYSDDSVINTSQAREQEYQESNECRVTSCNLLPPLPNCDIQTLQCENASSNAEESGVDDKPPDAEGSMAFMNSDLQKAEGNSLGSKLCTDGVSLESNDVHQVPVSSNDMPVIPRLISHDLGCSSESDIPLNGPSDAQLCLNSDIIPVSENRLEEIVITIDLNAAKVMLCKNPKACMKQLHSKLVKMVWCLLPELQASPCVFESLENLEFLIDLIIMSNSQTDVETSLEIQSLFPKVETKPTNLKSSTSSQGKTHVRQVAASRNMRHKIRKTQNKYSLHLRKSNCNRESLKRRTKISEQSMTSKLKVIKSVPREHKNELGNQKKMSGQLEAGNRQNSVKQIKKYFSEKSKSKGAVTAVVLTEKMFSDEEEKSENNVTIESSLNFQLSPTTDESQTNGHQTAPLKSSFLFELQLESKMAEKPDRTVIDKNEKKTNSISSDSALNEPSSHNPSSPEKTEREISPDTKRRSIDKNIFELLQPTPNESSL